MSDGQWGGPYNAHHAEYQPHGGGGGEPAIVRVLVLVEAALRVSLILCSCCKRVVALVWMFGIRALLVRCNIVRAVEQQQVSHYSVALCQYSAHYGGQSV